LAEDSGPVQRRPISRRSLLLAGTAVAAAGGAGTWLAFHSDEPVKTGIAKISASSTPVARATLTTVERVYSKARSREVDMVIALPSSNPAPGLPVCLFLHGRHGTARTAMPGSMATELRSAVAKSTIPPFALVAVDGGGDGYWHDGTPDGNSMSMLLDEVPGWLAARGLGGEGGMPFACAGISMGGFGALLYARRRAERATRPAAVAAISPALITTWQEMSSRNAFRDAADWASMDPLKHVETLAGVPVGVWCGVEDPFIEGSRKFIAAAKPEIGYTGPGGHADSFYRHVAPDVIGFLGRRLRQRGQTIIGSGAGTQD